MQWLFKNYYGYYYDEEWSTLKYFPTEMLVLSSGLFVKRHVMRQLFKLFHTSLSGMRRLFSCLNSSRFLITGNFIVALWVLFTQKKNTVALPTFKNVLVTTMTDYRMKGRSSLLEGALDIFPHVTFRTVMWPILPFVGSALAVSLTKDKAAGFIN